MKHRTTGAVSGKVWLHVRAGTGMEILIKLVRWLAGLALGFIAYGALRAGDTIPFTLMLAGALVVLPPVGALAGRLATPVGRHSVAIALGFTLVLAGLAVAGLTSDRAPVPGETPGSEQAGG